MTERNRGDKRTNKMTKTIIEEDDKGGKLSTTSASVVTSTYTTESRPKGASGFEC